MFIFGFTTVRGKYLSGRWGAGEREGFGGSRFDTGAEGVWYRRRFHDSRTRRRGDGDDDEFADGGEEVFGVRVFPEPEDIADGFAAHLGDEEFDLSLLFEEERLTVVGTGFEARPAGLGVGGVG